MEPVTQTNMSPDAAERFQTLETRARTEEYNFKHFTPGILLEDAQRTIEVRGIRPGEVAPDFTLPSVGGGELRLSSLRGRPVVLHFGSIS